MAGDEKKGLIHHFCLNCIDNGVIYGDEKSQGGEGLGWEVHSIWSLRRPGDTSGNKRLAGGCANPEIHMWVVRGTPDIPLGEPETETRGTSHSGAWAFSHTWDRIQN